MKLLLLTLLIILTNVITETIPTSKSGYPIIDENGEFNTGLSKYMKECKFNFGEKDSRIHVISIIGSQSTGKSTLLNLLFNTNFKIMGDEIKRTTQGILISPVENSNILILDNEGVDGYENYQDRYGNKQKLERKLALFSIYTSDIVMINIMENDINRSNGANIPLFENIFDVFSKNNAKQKTIQVNNKKLLLFIIRDFSNRTSLDQIKKIITKQFKDTWNKTKPIGFNHEFEDYFNLECESLTQKPGKKPEESEKFYKENLATWQSKQNLFDREIEELKERFFNHEKSNYIFKNETEKFMINYTEFSEYAEFIWDNIKSNSDLDIPTSNQLLITFKFKRSIENAYNEFKSIIKIYEDKVSNDEYIDKKKQEFDNLKDKYIEMLNNYEEKAVNYNKFNIFDYKKLKNEAINKIETYLNDFYSLIMSKSKENDNNITKEFENEIANKQYYKKIEEGKIIKKQELDDLKKKYIEKYDNEIGLYKEFNTEYKDMKQIFENKINLIYKSQLDVFKSKSENEYNLLSLVIQNKLKEIFKNKDSRVNFWDELIEDLKRITDKSINIYEKLSMEYDYEINFKEDLKEIKNDSFNKFIKLLKKEILNQENDIENLLLQHFENHYCKFYKVHQLMKTKENIMNESIEEAQNIIQLLSETKFSEDKFKTINEDIKIVNEYKILEDDKVRRILDEYKYKINNIYDKFSQKVKKSLFIGAAGILGIASVAGTAGTAALPGLATAACKVVCETGLSDSI